jgi:hypothetical protein
VSRWRPERLVLGLDAERLAGSDDAAPAPAGGWDASSLQAALSALAGRGADVQVLLAPDLCKHFVHQAPAGLQSLAELRELAALRAAQLFGGAAADWAVVADWRLATPCVCAALPQSLLQGLQAAAAALKLTLSVQSALLLALERVMLGRASKAIDVEALGGYVAWFTPRHTVLVGVRGHTVHSLRCVHRAAAADAQVLSAQLQRELAREGLLAGDSDTRLVMTHPLTGLALPDAEPGRWLEATAGLDEAGWAHALGGTP